MAANFLRFHGQLFCDVASMNPFFNRLKKHEFDDTLLAIVATGLEPDAFESDGVVTIRSQTALSGCSYERVALNHFEILLDSSVAEMTRRHVFD